MKKYFIPVLAVLALGAVSCNKEVPSSVNEGRSALTVSFVLNAPTLTRAAGDAVADTEAERTVSSYDIYAFRSDGSLDTYYGGTADQGTLSENATGAFTTGEFYVSNATLDFWVIANPPAALKSSVSSLSTLQSAVSAFTDNAAAGNGFVMVGYKQQNILALSADGEGVKHVTGVELERIVNKVSVKKITKAFESAALQAATVKLEGAWVVMAKKQAGYTVGWDAGNDVAGSADADYYNYDSSHLESNALISWDIAAASQPVIAASAGTAIGHDFYFYPNPAAVAASAASQDFVTKIVLKVNIGGTSYFYPIGIQQNAAPEAARNRYYEISNVTLRRPGNPTTDDINDYIDASIIDVAITVKDWVSADITGSYNYDLLN